MMKQKISVGVFDRQDYAVKRNIYGKAIHLGVCYMDVESKERLWIHELANVLHLDISWQMSPGIARAILLDRSLFYVKPIKDNREKVDIIHVWNQVCDTKDNWGVTLETALPHLVEPEGRGFCRIYENYVIKRDWELITHNNCRFIITFSQNTYNELKKRALEYSPAIWNIIASKTRVLLPPQRRIISNEEIQQKFLGKEINIIFVGRYFLIKGGMEMLSALRDLRKEYEFHLTVIGGLEDYHQGKLNPLYTAKEISDAADLLKSASWITWYKKLDHAHVLDLMKKSHIGMFPSYCDTFGYVVLEMQASGCPVLTTDINAMPEINDDNRGWICHLNTPIEEYHLQSEKVRKELVQQIEEHMIDALEDRNKLEEKALLAANVIEENFSPEKFAAEMYEIYMQARKGGK